MRWRSVLLWLAAMTAPACSTPPSSPPPDVGDGPLGQRDAAPPLPSTALGATVDAGGVTFRVWAPSARAVAVAGEFSAGAPLPLSPQRGGMFAARVPGARAGQRYRYQITAADGSVLWRSDPRGRQLIDGQSVVIDPLSYRWQSAPYQRPGKNALVAYELHPGSFSCPQGPASCGFAGIAARLGHLSDLGINVIELMPANGHGSTRGWGYNPQSYYAPHGPYGTPDDLRALVDQAHGQGIAVVLDVVYNHYDGWKGAPLYCYDGDCPDGGSGPYFFTDAKYRSTPWGPRFDFARGQVADFIADNVAFFRAEYRIDGFRWDSVSNIRALDGQGSVPGGTDLIRRANGAARALPGALLIAEDLKGWGGVTAPDGLGFDTQWDGGFGAAVTGAVSGYDDAVRNIFAVRDVLLGSYNGDPFQRLIYTETHDTVGNGGMRLPSRIDPADPGSFAARKRSMLASALLLTAAGVPMLFQGQEVLSIGGFADPPQPIDWSRAQAHEKVLRFYRDLLRLRRNRDGTTPGLLGRNTDVYVVSDANKVLAYRRWDRGGDDLIVVANFKNRAYTRYDIGMPRAGTWQVLLNSDDRRYSDDFAGASSADVVAFDTPRDGQPATGPIALGPYSVVVLGQAK